MAEYNKMNHLMPRRFKVISQTDMTSNNNTGKRLASWRNFTFRNPFFCNTHLKRNESFIKLEPVQKNDNVITLNQSIKTNSLNQEKNI